ncbi:alpha/beta fold hydrolase [Hoeflea olei]|uniref:HTH luxR-type domain-containing protein n=1 Tax=Hoeflea olei TaxID=1480615 RepID=A0A1C1Z0P6_9HYPH|nr:alpha/beta fold hydrolase [Hoeflea olei]OCW59322.1 hypothetical protein AWJ14_09770 [Hoeflea olei]
MTIVGDPAPLNKAVEAIYSYFKGDQEFTEFMKDLEDFLSVGEARHPVFTGEIGKHFDIAAELAQVMAPAPEARYRALVEGPALRIVVDRALRVVALSQPARAEFGSADGLVLAPPRRAPRTASSAAQATKPSTGADRLQASLGGAVLAGIAALFDGPDEEARGQRSFVRSDCLNGFVSLLHDAGLDVVVVTLPAAASRSVPAVLSESLGLSPSEVEVLELMAQGKSNVEISKERARSVDTVKSQTQAIFRKLGVASRLEAVQVVNDLISLATLSGSAGDPVPRAAPDPRRFPFAHDASAWRLTEREGRRISHVHYPPPRNGDAPPRTVLMFHGLLQGPEATSRFRTELGRAGFELIGASKPGYGATDRQPASSSFMRTSLEDARHLCDLYRRDRVVVLGHLFGAHAAIEFCLAHPDRVSGLVLCSAYFPLQIADHLVPVGPMQKLAMSSGIASAAAHQFITLSAVAYLRYGGAHRYLSAVAEHSTADAEALRDSEIYALLRAGLRHVTGNGSSAFLSDTSSSNTDWSGLLSRLALPVTVLHGETDPAVNVRLARLAAARIPGARYEELAGLGQNLLHTEPHRITAALDEVSKACR